MTLGGTTCQPSAGAACLPTESRHSDDTKKAGTGLPWARPRRENVRAMRKLLQGLAALWIVCIAGTFALPAGAQSDFPTRPIKMYVPFPPGGGIDVTARIAADQLSKALGQTIVIINQGGGGGAIATDAVVRSNPDGYTLLYHSVTGIVHASVTRICPTTGCATSNRSR